MAFPIPHFAVTLNAGSGGGEGFGGDARAGERKYSTPASTNDPGGGASFGTPACPHSWARKSWEWWFCASVLVPLSHPAVSNNITAVDTHNTPHDVGGVGTAGIGWGWGDFVSSQEFIYNAPTRTMKNQHEPNYPNHLTTLVTGMTGQRYDFVIQMILGRLDQQLGLAGPGVSGGGIGSHPNNGYGRTRIWVNGSDTPIDSGNINNLQRATNPNNGLTYTQTLFYRTWDVWYTGALSQQVTAELYATRMGTTVSEALADGSTGFTLQSEVLQNASIQSLADLSSDQFLVPSQFGGVPAPPPPSGGTTQTGPWAAPIQWNSAVPVDPPPNNPPTAIEQMIGPWGAPIQWNSTAAPVGVGAGGRFFKRFHGPAQLSGDVSDLYTVPSGKRAVIRHIHVSNAADQSVDFTFSIGTDAAATRLWDGYPIAAGDLLQHFRDHTLNAGEKIQAYASSNALNLTVEGYEESLEQQASGAFGDETFGGGTFGSGTYGT